MSEKYTIVIPAKNSLRTLRYTLQTCLMQGYPNLEIVVSDNCSEDGTADYIRNLGDQRVRYYHTGRPLSMSDNFEFGLSKVTEGFILFIGSDDGLMPDAITYADEQIRRHNVLAMGCQYAQYFWPDVPVPQHGRLILNALGVNRSGTELRNSREWIQKTISFQTPVYVCDLPSLYYGIVHRSVVDKAMKDGRYFRSITPDGYAAFATAANVDQFLYSYRPFVIAGISARSNGLSQSIGSDLSKSFVAENTHPIHKDFVFCNAFEVITGECYSQFADAFPEKVEGLKLDIPVMLKRSLLRTNDINSGAIREAVEKMAVMHNVPLGFVKGNSINVFGAFLKRTFSMLRDLFLRGSRITGIKDSEPSGVKTIYDASIVLGVLEMSNNGIRIETIRSKFSGRVKKRLGFSKYKDTL